MQYWITVPVFGTTFEGLLMLDEQQLSHLKSTLENAQSLLVVVGDESGADEVATALGIHLTMRNAGKDSRIVSVSKQDILPKNLAGVDQFTTELGNENLTISFDYSEEKVDKVSYHIGEDTQKFYLTIKPKAGQPPLDTNTVEFNYTGATADIIILCGVSDLEELEQLYYGYENLYTDATLVTFGKRKVESSSQHIADSEISNAQTWVEILQSLSFPISAEAASDFLYGIEVRTHGLTSSNSTPEIFEMVAWLIRAGGKRVYKSGVKSSIPQNGIIQQKSSTNNSGIKKKNGKPIIINKKQQRKSSSAAK